MNESARLFDLSLPRGGFTAALRMILVPSALLVGTEVNAQRVVGEVSDPGGTPVSGALVELVSGTGHVLSRGLTGSSGAFVLRAPHPGDVALSVGMIGFETTRTEAFAVGAGQTVRRVVVMTVSPVKLTALTASVEPRCGDPEVGSDEVARLWEQARTALSSVVLLEASPYVYFRTATTIRDLDPETDAVWSEAVSGDQALGAYPFRSPTAGEALSTDFIRSNGDTLTYYAPDPSILTSPEFLERYCFSVRTGRTVDEVGLAFEPVPAGRATRGVVGVLWLDRESAAMKHIDYRYLRPPVGSGKHEPRGRLDLERLENGAWIIRRWEIRAPRPAIVNGSLTTGVVSIHETVGRVIEVQGLDRLVRNRADRTP